MNFMLLGTPNYFSRRPIQFCTPEANGNLLEVSDLPLIRRSQFGKYGQSPAAAHKAKAVNNLMKNISVPHKVKLSIEMILFFYITSDL